MAMPDHKGLVRPSFPLDGTFSRLPSPLYATPPHNLAADIDAAVRVLQHMLDEGEALHHAVTQGLPTHPQYWPLMGPHTLCFEETIHYLREYGRALGHE